MTCREKLKIEHPDKVDLTYVAGCDGCPSDYGYLPPPDSCIVGYNCFKCWDREIPGTEKSVGFLTSDDRLEFTDKSEESTTPHILDSGDRTEFASGAVRDMREGKGRCDLLPLDVIAEIYATLVEDDGDEEANRIFHEVYAFQNDGQVCHLQRVLLEFDRYEAWSDMLLEVAKHFEEGAKKYGEDNWRKGIPVKCYIDSAIRHYLKYLRGDKDEPHDRAFVWNILCCIWTCKHKPELNEYAKETK